MGKLSIYIGGLAVIGYETYINLLKGAKKQVGVDSVPRLFDHSLKHIILITLTSRHI